MLASSFTRSGDLVARYGGQEFVRANVVALAIPHAFGLEGIVTVSIGVVTSLSYREVRSEDFVRAADAALYIAKDAGRNCVRSAPGLLAMLAVRGRCRKVPPASPGKTLYLEIR